MLILFWRFGTIIPTAHFMLLTSVRKLVKESKFIQSYYFDNNQLEKCVQKDGFETGSEYLDYLIEKVMKIVPKFFKDVQ